MRQAEGAVPLREQQRAFTRSRLLQAGQQVFAAKGYPEATVDDIAREAGASRATFYLHFKGKSELAAALVDDAIPFAVSRYDALDELLDKGGPGLRKQLHSWLSDWLVVWQEDADAGHALQQAGMLEPEVEVHQLHLSEALIDSLERYLASMPKSARVSGRGRALILEIMTQRIFGLASRSKLPIDNKTVVDILTGIWFEVLVENRPPGAR
jgi:AcrR family transcriptional regulator